MLLNSIENLIQEKKLLVKKEIVNENNEIYIAYIPLTEDLKVGEEAYFANNKNKIKKISENEYMFVRLDSIDTHIENFDVNYDLNKIYQNINKNLDYNLVYGDDRLKLVNELLEDNLWIHDLISTNRMIAKEIKKKSSFLAEDQKYDKIISAIATYILRPKFKNKEDELKYKNLLKEKEHIERKSKKDKTKTDYDRLNELIKLIQDYKLVKKEKLTKHVNTTSYGDLAKREKVGDFIYQEEIKDRNKKAKFIYHKQDIPNEYWLKMFSDKRKVLIPFYDEDLFDESKNKSIRPHELRPKLLNQMKDAIEQLKSYLGLNIKNKEKRIEYVNELKNKIGVRDYKIIRKMYTQLKADYELAKKILTDEFHFKNIKQSTVYDINSDTWYEEENGNIVEISKNMISFGNINTYKGLILNYKDLLDKYNDKQRSDWWALLKDFEYILRKTEFTEEERFVLDVLFDGYNQKQIREKYEQLNLERITKDRISRMINDTIPNKLLNTYLDIVQDWLVIRWHIGKYKVCSKCGEAKLANERYFGKDLRNKDNLKSICKKCDNNYTK